MIERAATAKALKAAAAAFALLAFAARAEAGPKLTSASAMLPRNGQSSGGAPVAAGALKLNNTVGDTFVGAYAGGGLKFQAGLAAEQAQPGSVPALSAVSKSTGDLTLSWSAPGLDGFQGDAVSGFYRVDYSSDPLHVFSPTLFQLEFPTATTVGAAQSIRLTGLLPNTTYYAKVYLADARKYFADDSARSGDSTLANAPVNPYFSAVYPSSVTISWLLPVGGAEGYQQDGSTTNFGALFPGGVVTSSATPNGLLLSLTLGGLTTNTTYYFKVASLNWQGDKNYSVILSTLTPVDSLPLPVLNLAAGQDALMRRVQVTWTNPAMIGQQGVLVLLSTTSFSSSVADGLSFTPGQVLGDAAVVKSTQMASSFNDGGLALDTTYYYHVFTQGLGVKYSVVVSTRVFLDLPPMAAAGLTASSDPGRTLLDIRWSPVVTNLDGSPFSSAVAPKPVELARFELFRSTGLVAANWVLVGTMAYTTTEIFAPIPTPSQTYFYKLVAVDSFGTSDQAMVVDTEGNLYALSNDGVTRLKIPSPLTPELTAAQGRFGSDVLVRALDLPADPANGVFRSVRFAAVHSPNNLALWPFQLSRPDAEIDVHYAVNAGMISTSDSGPLASSIPAYDAASRLGMYWHNGDKYTKLFGKVDAFSQTVAVNNAFGGSYQVRALVREQGFSFDLSGVSNKAITPNGDGLNDTVVFTFDNPKDSAFSGRVFDMRGGFVADMTPGPLKNTLQWDGKAGGRVVRGGVYFYQIRSENKNFTGTVVVIK